MATAVLNKAMGKITDKVIYPGSEKKASTFAKAVCIFADKKSVKDSLKLVNALEDIIDNKLPSANAEFDKNMVAANFKNINENLQKIDSFISLINKIFQDDSVELDLKSMSDLMANLHKAKNHLSYISDYLELVLQVQAEKNSEKKKSSFNELINLIKAA